MVRLRLLSALLKGIQVSISGDGSTVAYCGADLTGDVQEVGIVPFTGGSLHKLFDTTQRLPMATPTDRWPGRKRR